MQHAKRTPSKEAKKAPGDYFPEPESKRYWGLSLWAIMLPVGALLGATLVITLFDSTRQALVGALAGIAIACTFCLRFQDRIVRDKARRHYQRLANIDPKDADACVQAGLWILKRADTKEEIERGDRCFRVALARQPGHRDAIVSLALSLSIPRKARPAKHKEAVDLLEPWLLAHDDLYGEAIAARALGALGDRKRAAAHYKRILKLFPDTPMREEIEEYLRTHTTSTDAPLND